MGEKIICGLVLAAGLSQRMGDFKPLLPLRGKTILENAIDSMLAAGVESVTVVLGYRGAELEALLREHYGETVNIVWNHDYATTDMLTSIKIGIAALPRCDAFFLLPGDMPIVKRETYLAVRSALPEEGEAIVFPLLDGYRKHPPLIHCAFIPTILSFSGEGGLRALWGELQSSIVTVNVDDVGCWTDLDTPEQYKRCLRRCEAADNHN